MGLLLLFKGSGGATSEPAEIRFIVEAAFGGLPGDETYLWTTIHDTNVGGYVRALTFSRGRNNQLDRIDTGTGNLVLNNADRAWDPQNAASPFYPYVRPMLPIRGSAILDGVTHFLFLHYADGFPRRRIGPNYSEVALSTVDGQESLALARIPPDKATLTVAQDGLNNDMIFTAKQPGPAGNDITVAFFETHFRPLRAQRVVITVTGTNIRVDYIDDGTVQVDEVLTALQANVAVMLLVDVDNVPGSDGSGDMHPFDETHLSGGDTVAFPAEPGGDRISRCLDLIDWPDTLRSISGGQDTHQEFDFPTDEAGKVLSHMQDIASICSENGLLFIDGAGRLVFLDRVDKLTANATPAAVFSDNPGVGEYAYVDATPNNAKDLIVNDATAARDGGDAQLAYDAASVEIYRRRSKSFTSTLDTDLHVLAAVQAAVVELKDPLDRVDRVTVMPGNDLTFWDVVLGLEIGSRITLKEHPPGGGAANSADYIIQGQTWQITGALVSTKIVYNLWPADPISNWFILDDPVRGLLDAGNRLGR